MADFVSERNTCSLCNKQITNFLHHLRIQHKIRSAEEYEIKLEIKNNEKLKQKEFANYVDKLKKMIANKEIIYEQYRELITKWMKDNKR